MKHWFYWDIHTDKVSRRAKAWASTDRGWLFCRGKIAGFERFKESALGHYLDYGPVRAARDEFPDGSIHAVSCVSKASQWFFTPDEAQYWLMTQASLDLDRVKGGRAIQLRAQAIERARVIAALGLAPEDPSNPYVGTTGEFLRDLAERERCQSWPWSASSPARFAHLTPLGSRRRSAK